MITYFDGGMGTMLNLKAGELPELLNINDPERVYAIHKAYADAGCNIISANTFGANRFKYDNVDEIVKSAVKNAKRTGKKVALDIGPTGKLLKPMGDLDFEECVDIFADVVKAGRDEADLVLLETFGDLYEIKAAMLAVKENCDLPLVVSMIFDEKARLLTGADVRTACAVVEGLGADAIGFNCGLGPKQMIPLVEELEKHASIPILVMPNAGLPESVNGETIFNVDPDEFASYMTQIAKMGVSYLGGCCGTTPAHLKAMIEATKDIEDKVPEFKNETIVASYSKSVDLSEGAVIGERINPTGKKLMKEALRNKDMDYVLRQGITQSEAGAHILDVNMGLPEIDEKEMLCSGVYELQSVLPVPLQLDSGDAEAMEAALRLYNGKAMINSVNGKEKSMKEVFPLAKKYGGVVVCLCLDEDGIPSTAQGRIAIAKKIIKRAAEYGIDKKNLAVDALVMTISTDTNNAIETLNAVDYIRNTLGVNTVLGVSNISFGLPNREAVNTAFYTLAMSRGLSAGIINPNSRPMMNAFFSYKALAGKDESCQEYIKSAVDTEIVQKTENLDLKTAIIKGMKEESARCAKELLENTESLVIINDYIIPALDVVGDGFEKNTIFLPQLLMSADSAKAAFDEIKAHFVMSGAEQVKGEKIIIATVEGDIHDIGKNIVKVLLQNYGFDVMDLGKDVKCEKVLEEAQKNNVKLVGLSALMTTTVPNMEKTIKLLHDNTDAKVFVGGAVLTRDYAKMINADFYAKDAMESVRIAQEFFEE
ncbi:homocysteine S-methyltransferase family protein [Eubacterium sp.]|uniref:homocysteine S-methyltransferase family protein n=1 Tax=Eubacterium sp. TaxID=142586 RepID=UPI002A820EB3|nr:homocysteine S-methyltransferase family protein [Eubacterium sp.]MDY3811493.1 homocysteine S-methyltransferase family protein [Eubacterium sp.]MDY5242562.1 homocysteine S-methyltransferase family protein [Eubacterium sp.]